MFILALVENCQRKDLNPIEIAKAITELRNRKLTWREIKGITRLDDGTARQKQKFLELPENVQAMLARGELTQDNALLLLKYKAKPEEITRLAKEFGDDKIPVEILNSLLKPRSESKLRKLKSEVPKMPEDLLLEILKFGGTARKISESMEAFLKLPPHKRNHVVYQLNPDVRDRLRRYCVVLARQTLEFLERVIAPSLERDRETEEEVADQD